MKRFDRLWKGLQQEGKVFIFFVVLLTIFRIVFLGIFANTLADVKFHDIWMTLWYGFRISLKTIGVICLVPFVVATLVQTFRATWPAQAIRRIWYSLATIVMTLLFIIRIPYYHIFESGYNLMLVNGAHDDIGAIINTAINEYHAIPYLIVAIIACAILVKVINKILSKEPISWEPKNPGQLWVRTGEVTILLVIFAIFCRWGGAFSYTHSINWENATRMSSTLLNETILDDAQALYRVRTIHKRMQQFHKVDLTEEQLKEKIVALGGKPAGTIDESFKHTIDKEKLPIQPQTVTFILGESYGLWPMLPQYASFGDYVAHEGKSLTQKGMSADYLLAQGTGTMPAVNGFLTGMPDVGLFPNYEPTSYQASYGMGIASVMKGLGYKTVFWYGGFGSWQDVKRFALSQNFDEFHDASDLNYQGGNAWGAPDKDLFRGIEAYTESHKGEKIFNFVLTTTNHPPYNMDLAQEGFDQSKLGTLPDDIGNKPDTIQEIGTFWYADHTMGQFVKSMQAQDPSGLFIITGDHSERFNFAKEVSPMVRSTIPAIFYGQGLEKSWMPDHQFGMAIQLIPTIAQLVGRPGQSYEAMVPSLFDKQSFAFNHALWSDGKTIHSLKDPMDQNDKDWMDTMRQVSAWRIIKGNNW